MHTFKFKDGDQIKCIDVSKSTYLTKEKIYTAGTSYISPNTGKELVNIEDDHGIFCGYFVTRFELVCHTKDDSNIQELEKVEIDYLKITRELSGM